MLRQELESDSWLKIAIEEVQRYRRMRERGKSYSNERRKGVKPTESQLPDDNCVVVSVQADTNMESSPHTNDQMISDTSDSDLEAQLASSAESELTGDESGVSAMDILNPEAERKMITAGEERLKQEVERERIAAEAQNVAQEGSLITAAAQNFFEELVAEIAVEVAKEETLRHRLCAYKRAGHDRTVTRQDIFRNGIEWAFENPLDIIQGAVIGICVMRHL